MVFAPLVRPAVCIVAGVILGDSVSFPFPPHLPIALIITWILLERPRSSRPLIMTARTVVAHLSLCCIGIAGARFVQSSPNDLQPGTYCGELEVIDRVSNKEKVSRAFARIYLQLDGSLQTRKVLLVHFNTTTDSTQKVGLQRGARYRFRGKIDPFPMRVNPHAFDSRSYYQSQGLSGELIADSLACISVSEAISPREQGRVFLHRALASVNDQEVRALFTALLSGDKRNLSATTREAFARCGIMHLLAVSGLHVGLIAIVPLFILRRSRRLPFRIIAFLGVLLVVWSFAWFTGFPASVQRAGATLTLFALGGLLKLRTSGINLLAGAAILLVVLDPGMPYNIGFQLSFAAVAAILLWGPVISNQLPQKHRWQRYLASSASVSIAAQAGTSPFSLYYFHQFPVLFLPVNLIAVPFATIIMYVLMITMVASALALDTTWLTQFLAFSGRLLIDGAIAIAQLDYSAIEGVFVSAAEAAGWGCIGLLIFRKWRDLSRVFIPLGLLTSAMIVMIAWRTDCRSEVVVFSRTRTPVIGFTHNDSSILLIENAYQSSWPASGWIDANNAEVIRLTSDTSLMWMNLPIEKQSGVMRIGPLAIHDGCHNLEWKGLELHVKKNAAIVKNAAGHAFGWNLSKEALQMKISSTGLIDEVYGQRKPPIPQLQKWAE